MAVVILALIAVVIGFLFIAIMGKTPIPVLQDETLEQRGGRPVAQFADIEEFQQAVAKLLAAQGLQVSEVRGVSEDEFELFAQSGGGLGSGTIVFHCIYATEPVGADRVSNLLSAVRGERALKGIFITTGYFTADVHNIAEGPAVELVNIERFSDLLEEYGVSYRRSDEQVST